MTTGSGRSGSGEPSGHSPKGGASISVESPAKPSVPNAMLCDRLLANFLDGTLANAVEQLAQDADDPVARSCLYEAADKLRAGCACYVALESQPDYSADTTFAAIWQFLDRKDNALAKVRGKRVLA